MGWCEHITAASLSILASNCSGLESLDLCGCSKVTQWSFNSCSWCSLQAHGFQDKMPAHEGQMQCRYILSKCIE